MLSELLFTQYTLVQQSRHAVFKFLEENVRDDLAKPLPVFNEKTISYMYVHIANCYIAWAGNFALKGSITHYNPDEPLNISQIKKLFEQIDEIMDHFITHFSTDPIQAVKGYKWPGKYIETDSYSIFTHVITHEFHHKGQAMTMARILGHIPVDTDVIRF